MGGRETVLRPISTFPITINTFSMIVKGGVADLLRYTPTSSIITPNITSFFHEDYHQRDEKQQIYAKIYHIHLGYGRNSGYSGTCIRLSNHHQRFIQDSDRKIGWYL